MNIYQNSKGNAWPKAGRKNIQRPLQKTSGKYGYEPMRHTPALCKHTSRNISFTLVVDDFEVNYSNRKDTEYLRNSLQFIIPRKHRLERIKTIGTHP